MLLTRGLGTRRIDTYSFGVVISEVHSKKTHFSDVPRSEKTGLNSPLMRAIKAGKKRVRNDASWSSEIRDLVDRCTRFSPDERPAFGEVVGILKALVDRSASAAADESGQGVTNGKNKESAAVVKDTVGLVA